MNEEIEAKLEQLFSMLDEIDPLLARLDAEKDKLYDIVLQLERLLK